MLKPGETREVKFTLGEQELGFWHKDMTFGAETGEFDLMIGGNSADLKKTRVRLTE